MVANLSPTPTGSHRIGTVSRLAGIPAPTLRVWETRYQAFSPVKTAGRQRMYSEEDLLRATLLKQLSDVGHAIGTIARLDAVELRRLRQRQQPNGAPEAQPLWPGTPGTPVAMAVVGLGLAGRVESGKHHWGLVRDTLQVTDSFDDLDRAQDAELAAQAQLLLVRANTLHEVVMADILRLAQRNRIPRVMVLYSYGKERVAQAMRGAGMVVRREPLSDHELGESIRSALAVDAARRAADGLSGALIPARQYPDDVLARVAAASDGVSCECPRHVVEIITQLAGFEQYSQECLGRSARDARLHGQLAAVAGAARALFERALEMVARHEGIDLAPAASPQG